MTEVINAIRKLAGKEVEIRFLNKSLYKTGTFKRSARDFFKTGGRGVFGVSFENNYKTIEYSLYQDGKIRRGRTVNIESMYLNYRSTQDRVVLNVGSDVALTIEII